MDTAQEQAADPVPVGVELRVLRRLGLALLIVAICFAACWLLLYASAQRQLGFGQLSRLARIEDWYRAHAARPAPCIVALGDSLALSAFNGSWLNEQRDPALPEAWNLSSSACTYPEMMLVTGRPALAEATLVLFVSPMTSFLPSKLDLNSRKANTYALLGLPEGYAGKFADYGTALEPGALRHLQKPYWQHVLQSRWRLPEYAKNLLKRRVGPGVERQRYLLDCYVQDLHYAPFDSDLPPAEFQAALDERLARLEAAGQSGIGDARCQLALRDMLLGLSEHSARTVVVLYPMLPEYRDWLARQHPEYGPDWLAGQLSGDLEFLDLSDSCGRELFRDELHLNEAGSLLVTRRIREYLLSKPEDGP